MDAAARGRGGGSPRAQTGGRLGGPRPIDLAEEPSLPEQFGTIRRRFGEAAQWGRLTAVYVCPSFEPIGVVTTARSPTL